MIRLDDHHAVVVGGAGAIGAAITRAFATAGARLTVLDSDASRARQVIDGLPGSAHAAGEVDVTERGSVGASAEWSWASGAVDSVTYAAGVAETADLVDLDWDDYHRVLAVNLHGALHVAQEHARRMLAASRPGAFVFLASSAGKRPEAGASAYCASKFGLLGAVLSFAAEVADADIRVNAICPGNVDTPMLRRVAELQAARDGGDPEALLARYADEAAARRLVTVDEVAATAVFLASPLSSGIVGESVNVDAGALTP